MVGGGSQLDFLCTKCSSFVSHSHVFILGLILAYDTMLSCHAEATTVVCKSANISHQYQHCGIHPDGVHDLDCFGKYTLHYKTCMWKPGNHASEKTYTLIIQQQSRNYCRAHYNITDITHDVRLYDKHNMTAEVLENSESTNCTKAVFRALPLTLLRCGPPYRVSFSRRSGGLAVNVSWPQVDRKSITSFSVRYREVGSLLWNESPVGCQNRQKCTVENLNSSLTYAVQIQCVTNVKCTQCVRSETYNVPSELTTQPVIVNLEDADIAERKGCRLLTVTWKFSAEELYDGYYVTIGKASGEQPREQMNTTQPEIRLVLSYSAYQLNISAVNNVSVSPAVSHIIPQREDEPGMGAINMTVHSNTSFTINWEDDHIKNYICYSVEWMKKGDKAAFMSFYENENNFRTLSLSTESLEPYKRYSITLHVRPDKETCNLKHVNNSESTYGTTHFYFTEGSPVSAPANVTSCNVTLNSVVLQWSPIPEEDIRGFLLGYIIHYTEYLHSGTRTERNITVDPMLTSYELADLKSGTAYDVQISGFTRAGEGIQSKAIHLTTNKHEGYFNLTGIIIIFIVVATILIFGSPIIKRAKVILWPSIPNPGNSNTMQKIEGPSELELLQSFNTLKVEEWDTASLQIVENKVLISADMFSVLPPFHASEDEEYSPEMTCDWIHRDAEDATGDVQPDITAGTLSVAQQTAPFSCGYTTMEMFQQVMPQGVPANASAAQGSKAKMADLTVMKSGLDYVKHLSASPTEDNEGMSWDKEQLQML